MYIDIDGMYAPNWQNNVTHLVFVDISIKNYIDLIKSERNSVII